MKLTHLDKKGKAKMIDISSKNVSFRKASAEGFIQLQEETLKKIKENLVKKGDVLAVARIAGITGAKRSSDLIPLCHNILINSIEIEFNIVETGIKRKCSAGCEAKTGIEMEALTGVSIAALTIYDMCKAIDKKMKISDIQLLKKTKQELRN